MIKYEEVVFLQGDDTDEFFDIATRGYELEADDCIEDVQLEYVRQWDNADDAPESLTRAEVENNLGLGWSSFEDDYGFVAYHWHHAWVHYFRKVEE